MQDFVAIDFETCSNDRLACAVATAEVKGGSIVEVYETLICPAELKFDHRQMRIHKIPEEDIRNAPPLAEIWPALSARISGKTLVAHNASFDTSVLRKSLNASGLSICEIDYLCSISLARVAWPDFEFYTLDYICRKLNIELEHHKAGSDAAACAEVVIRGCEDLNVDTWSELEERAGIQRGHIHSNEEWTPPIQPRISSSRQEFELEIPDNYDIKTNYFYGKNVVLTGKFSFCSKDEGRAALASLGAVPESGTTRKTNVVVVGEVDSQKLARGKNITRKHEKALEYVQKGQKIEFLDEKMFNQKLMETNE